jgi:hypothetical protein
MGITFYRLAVASIGALAWVAFGCESSRPGSLHATVSIVDSEDSCAFDSPPGTTCTITRTLTVLLQEDGGRDVQLESVSGVLWDGRSMSDVHAEPAMLLSSDIRAAVGTSVVPAHGQLSLRYKLGSAYPVSSTHPQLVVDPRFCRFGLTEASCPLPSQGHLRASKQPPQQA